MSALNHHLKPDSDAVVAIAKKEGRWPPPHRCEACNTTKGRIVWHHHDYAHPVDVIPLCGSCHTRVHRGLLVEPLTGRMYPRYSPARMNGTPKVYPVPNDERRGLLDGTP
jgi:hypothetical protein